MTLVKLLVVLLLLAALAILRGYTVDPLFSLPAAHFKPASDRR